MDAQELSQSLSHLTTLTVSLSSPLKILVGNCGFHFYLNLNETLNSLPYINFLMHEEYLITRHNKPKRNHKRQLLNCFAL